MVRLLLRYEKKYLSALAQKCNFSYYTILTHYIHTVRVALLATAIDILGYFFDGLLIGSG